jgi:hypothetical protein
MERYKTIQQFLDEYPLNEKKDRQTMIDFGWYDWFCDETELKPRLDKLFPFLKYIVTELNLDLDEHYFWLKQIRLDDDMLFDRIGINESRTNENLFQIDFDVVPIPNSIYHKYKYCLHSHIDDYKNEIVYGNTLGELALKMVENKSKLFYKNRNDNPIMKWN